MTMNSKITLTLFALITCMMIAPFTIAQDTSSLDDPITREETEKELEELDRRANPLMIPTRDENNDSTPDLTDPETTDTTTTDTTTTDDQAPIVPQATPSDPQRQGVPPRLLRREGQFLINQRARLVRSTGMTGWKMVFEADDSGLTDPPMFVMPCRLLEDMVSLSKGRDDYVFIVSGQVFVYQNQNYILPTALRVVRDRGNLNQPTN